MRILTNNGFQKVFFTLMWQKRFINSCSCLTISDVLINIETHKPCNKILLQAAHYDSVVSLKKFQLFYICNREKYYKSKKVKGFCVSPVK